MEVIISFVYYGNLWGNQGFLISLGKSSGPGETFEINGTFKLLFQKI